MWVIVCGRSGPYYMGELDNKPVFSDVQEILQAGDRVIFLPEHVIQIKEKDGETMKPNEVLH